MRFKRPKIIGTLKIRQMRAGNLAVINDIKNSSNRIVITCRSQEHGEAIIEQIKNAKFGDVLHL